MKKFDIEVGDFVKHPDLGNGNIWFEVLFASPDECHINTSLTHSIKTAHITAHMKGKYIPEVGDWVCFKFVQGWFQVKELRRGLIYTVTGQCYNLRDVCDHKRITPISDTEFHALAVGDEVEVAPEWYIRSQCDSQMRYKSVSQTLDCCGVKAVVTRVFESSDVGVNNKMVHRDFILAVHKKGKPISTDHTPNLIQVGSWIKTDVNGWEKVTNISYGKIYTTNAYFFISHIKEVRVAIPAYEWAKVWAGTWVKIASEEYIKSKCILKDGESHYCANTYDGSAHKLKLSGSWIKVVSARDDKVSDGQYSWHRDFIVDISKTEPCATPVENGLTTAAEEAPVTKKQCDKHIGLFHHEMTWSQMNDLFTKARDRFQGIPMSEIPLPGVGGKCVLGTDKDDKDLYDAYFKYDIKKEKIMLNTVEEIGKLDKPNLEEAAKQVKASRDNDEVKAAKEKLTALLDNESRLKAQKERTDKDLAEVQELIKAFGYPPAK